VAANDYMEFMIQVKMVNLCITKYRTPSYIYSLQYKRTCSTM